MKLFRPYVLLAVAIATIAGIYLLSTQKTIYRFSEFSGPARSDAIKPMQRARLQDFSGAASSSRLAVLITDPDSDWLGLVHGLRTIGVPFVLTQDYKKALAHNVVLVYPTISGKVLAKDALQALASFPQEGGTLVGFEILGGGVNEVFGIAGSEASRSFKELRISDGEAAAFALPHAEDRRIPLAGKASGTAAYAFLPTTGKVVAEYDDGRAAIVRRDAGKGHAVAIGLDIGAYLAKAYNGRQEFDNHYVNAYTPAADSLLRILRSLYQTFEPLAVALDTVPDGRAASLIITHDVDYTKSIRNAVRYAEYEKASGIKATYFIQTKYVRDWNDDIFFDEHGAALTRTLASLGMEIASHSVSHSRVFSKFPLGDGTERYPAYLPFVKDKYDTKDGTILGELRVSRFLLESVVPGQSVVSFRPGHLEYPFALPQALDATGYRFSSTVTSGIANSHLPFKLNYSREGQAETAVFEFPITIEDELARPMTARLPATIAILDKLRNYGGMCVVLIHPDVFDDKLAFLEALVPKAKAMGAWTGTLAEFGHWWAARDTVNVDVVRDGKRVVFKASAEREFDKIAFLVPAAWRLDASAPGSSSVRQSGNRIVVQKPVRDLHLVFHL
ncbi:polysaccharide deacetylase family protein [Janthinobacterium sp. 17J80-10]|uniref:polysaccharide deacetylase family protein n=1 Tax=Janthinobacterium sp. 17J80-10 TaxID=2497863 RepID=UPI00100532AF|nr:polysaccharide deacetylase family protein [Janthinobacterium sp. 17J80-10]QAU34479.1 hypothetical protein EKL02_09965 [Janthinobacterium sp. 17J80-10]